MTNSAKEQTLWLDRPVSRPTRVVVTAAAVAVLVLAAGSAIATVANADGDALLTITPGVVVVLIALVSWWRTPQQAFSRLRWGRWWVGVGVVALSPAIGDVVLPLGALVWFAYQRPRLQGSD